MGDTGVDYTKKLRNQSNYWYNDGLKKANIRDLSGAVIALKRSLQYNRANIDARNLLGLVYFGRGEVMEALVEWIISKNLKTDDNLAEYFITKVQENASELEAVDQAVKKYNQCLVSCDQGGEDLAILQLKKVTAEQPSFLKAHQLLGLLLMHTGQYAKARQVLKRANKLDTTNEMTLRYMHELNRMYAKKAEKMKEERAKQEAISYNLGNETIIQPAKTSLKERTLGSAVLNMLIGLLVGAAVVWFLIVPAVDQSKAEKANQRDKTYSEKIATQKSQINAMQQELEEYRKESEAAKAAQQDAEKTKESYEALLKVNDDYDSRRYGNTTLAKNLKAVNADVLGEEAKKLYDELHVSIVEPILQKNYRSAKRSYNAEDYETAITTLEDVVALQETYLDGDALNLLAECYAKNGQNDKAIENYNKVITLFPDTDAAREAQEALDELNANTQNNNAGTAGNTQDQAQGQQ